MPDTTEPQTVTTYDDLIRAEDLWLDSLADEDGEFYPHPMPNQEK